MSDSIARTLVLKMYTLFRGQPEKKPRTQRVRISLVVAATLLCCSCAHRSDADIQIVEGIVQNPEEGIHDDLPESPIALELEQVFGAESDSSEAMIYGTREVITDGEDNVILFDHHLNALYCFDPAGNLMWKTGREGEGPGEFSNIFGIASNGEDLIYVSNQSGNRIDVFDNSGSLVTTHLMEEVGLQNVSLAGFFDPTTMVLTHVVYGAFGVEIVVLTVSDPCVVDTAFVVDQTDELQLPLNVASKPDVRVAGDMIAVSHVARYRIEFYSRHGQMVSGFARDTDVLVRPGYYFDEGRSGIMNFSNLSVPYNLANGFWLLQAVWPTNVSDPDAHTQAQFVGNAPILEFRNTVDLYDGDLRLLYTDEVEGHQHSIGQLLHVDRHGRAFIALPGEYFQIGRYNVSVNL